MSGRSCFLFRVCYGVSLCGVWEPPTARIDGVHMWGERRSRGGGYLEPEEPGPGVRRQVLRNMGVELHKVQRVGGTQNQGRHSSPAFVPWGWGGKA